jgi:hypothetical protein
MDPPVSAESAAVDVLRALLSGGPGWEGGRYLKPTITNLVADVPGAMISQRAAHRISFTFDESDGTRVSYECTVSQDDLFRALSSAGLLVRRDTGRRRPR